MLQGTNLIQKIRFTLWTCFNIELFVVLGHKSYSKSKINLWTLIIIKWLLDVVIKPKSYRVRFTLWTCIIIIIELLLVLVIKPKFNSNGTVKFNLPLWRCLFMQSLLSYPYHWYTLPINLFAWESCSATSLTVWL